MIKSAPYTNARARRGGVFTHALHTHTHKERAHMHTSIKIVGVLVERFCIEPTTHTHTAMH